MSETLLQTILTNFSLWGIVLLYFVTVLAFVLYLFMQDGGNPLEDFEDEVIFPDEYEMNDLDFEQGIDLIFYETDRSNVMVLENSSGGDIYNVQIDISQRLYMYHPFDKEKITCEKIENDEIHMIKFNKNRGHSKRAEISVAWDSHIGVTHEKKFLMEY